MRPGPYSAMRRLSSAQIWLIMLFVVGFLMSISGRPSKELPQEQPDALPNPLDMTDEEYWEGARDSVKHYEETGLHLTQKEVEDWMKRRSRGERVPMPKLHT